MKFVLALVYVFIIFDHAGMVAGHKGSVSHHKDMVDGHKGSVSHHKNRKELLKNILWHYFWQRDGVKHVTRDVGFLCSMSSHHKLTPNTAIKFNVVLRNDGQGYNDTTGTFTAPVGGLYNFYWSLLCVHSKNTDINLIHNNKRIIRSWIYPNSKVHDSASNTLYLRIRKGDTIYLQTTSSGGQLNGDTYTTFGGELIRY